MFFDSHPGNDPTRNERHLACLWALRTVAIALGCGATVMLLGWPATALHAYGLNAAWWTETQAFLGVLLHEPLRLVGLYRQWLAGALAATGLPPIAWMVAGAGALAIATWGFARNPYSFRNTEHGGARWATKLHVARMLEDGLFAKQGIVLGRRWGRYIRHFSPKAAMSGILIAPPGSGKTAAFAIPTLLTYDGSSIVVNDVKGELYEKTAGHRARIGKVFRIEWGAATGASWNPLSPEKSLPGGARYGQLMGALMAALQTVYASPIDARQKLFKAMQTHHDWREAILRDPASLGEQPAILGDPELRRAFVGAGDAGPAAHRETLEQAFQAAVELNKIQADRENYLVRLATILIPDRGGQDSHWVNTGRSALVAFMLFTIARCERDLERFGEPTFGKLIEFWTQDAAAMMDGESEDPMGEMLGDWIQECKEHGYPARCETELVTLAQKPDKERGSVISTADAALNVFKTATVRDRTSHSDFAFEELRGSCGHPVTVYLCVNVEDQESQSVITGLFVEALSGHLIAHQPKEKEIRGSGWWVFRRRPTKFPVGFLLDEAPQMPKIPQLLRGPAVSRSALVWYLIIGQEFSQFEERYGQHGRRQLLGNTAFKIILTQNELSTAKELSEMVGEETIRSESESHSTGWAGQLLDFSRQGGKSPFDRNVNRSARGRRLVTPQQIMSLPRFKVVVIVQNHAMMPIYCDAPVWFRDKAMRRRQALPAPDPESARGWCGALAGEMDTAAAGAVRAPDKARTEAARLIEAMARGNAAAE